MQHLSHHLLEVLQPNTASFFMTCCFCRRVFTACRPVSAAPFSLSSVSSVVPVMLLAQQHVYVCVCLLAFMWKRIMGSVMCVWFAHECIVTLEHQLVFQKLHKGSERRSTFFYRCLTECSHFKMPPLIAVLVLLHWGEVRGLSGILIHAKSLYLSALEDRVTRMWCCFVRAQGWAFHCDPALWQCGNPP